MHRIQIVSLALAGALMLPALPSEAFDDGPEVYKPPEAASCSINSNVFISVSGDCLRWSGKVKASFLHSSADGALSFMDSDLAIEGEQPDGNTTFGFKIRVGSEDTWKFRPYTGAGNGPWVYFVPMMPNLKEAYVSVGGRSFLRAGRVTETIGNTADDEPFGFLKTFGSESIDAGVGWQRDDDIPMDAVQGLLDVGTGFTIGGAIEELQHGPVSVGVINYSAAGLTAHVTAYGPGRRVSDLVYEGSYASAMSWHAGVTADVGAMRLRSAAAFNGDDTLSALAAIEWTIGMANFDLAIDTQTSVTRSDQQDWGLAASGSHKFTSRITASAGYRMHDFGSVAQLNEIATEVEYRLSESLDAKIGGNVMWFTGNSGLPKGFSLATATGSLLWQPGGEFRAELGGSVNSAGAHKMKLEIEKNFN